MGVSLGRVALLLFGSGACALIYQVAWLRELRLVFGASTAASAAVLAVFMGGLGLGGAVLGRRVVTARRPLDYYARLELGVALISALTPLLLSAARAAYFAVGGTVVLGMGGGTVARLLITTVVLLGPTFLMGGTLPAAAQAIETPGDLRRRRLAVLYGVNTLGAVTGAALSTFVLLEALGTRRMLWSACLINALVALVARSWARRGAEAEGREPRETTAKDPAGDAPGGTRAGRHLVLVAAAIIGFAFLLMELVWYRMLGPLLGGSSFTFGLILAVALAGIGLGGAAYALLGADRRATAWGFALTCALEALFIALPFALGDRVALLAALLRPLGSVGFAGHVLGWSVIVGIVVLPAAFVSGVQFPLLIGLLGQGRGEVGRELGLAYAWNTAGAILGSLAGGFGLVPLLSAPGAWRLVVALLVALALASALIARRDGPGRARLVRMLAPLVSALGALWMIAQPGPTAVWRHSAVGVGRAPTSGSPNELRDWMQRQRRAIVWEQDGVESSVALDAEIGLGFVVNGKVDGNARGDAATQVMSGLLGALLHPRVEQALVIGLGTGSTAGWLGALPDIRRVDAVELEPAIFEVARRCAPVNRDVMSNPKVHHFVGDAREVLSTTPEKYDLVFSEPSNPYRAGIASLFTRDFYDLAVRRLKPGGLFIQWFQAYEVDAQTVRTVYATFSSVFPHAETWLSQESDMLLVGSLEPITYDVARMRARIATEPYRGAMARIWGVDDVEGVFARYVARSSLAHAVRELEGEDISTDDHTLVEFAFARNVGRRSLLFSPNELRQVANARSEERPDPARIDGAVEWSRVLGRRVSMLTAQGIPARALPYRLPAEVQHRALAESHWLSGNLAAARLEWRAQPDPPGDPIELAMAAELVADAPDETEEAALGLIERLRAVDSIEADVALARLELRLGRSARAADALERAWVAYRSDPWPLLRMMEHAFELGRAIADRDRTQAERLYRALEQPFAVSLFDDLRRMTRIELAARADWKRLCAEAYEAVEPNPPWRREFLLQRWRCYAQAAHGRAAQASSDYQDFVAADAFPFSVGLIQSP